MSKTKQILIIAAVVTVSALSLQAQTITREDFLDRLQETHPKFKKEQLTIEIRQIERRALLGGQDWNASSSFFYSHEQPSIASTGPERTNSFSVAGGLSRTFWKTGGRFTADFSTTHASLKIDPIWGYPESFFENRLAVSYEHPLLRNKRGLLDRLEFDLKQYDIDFSQVRASENLEDFLGALSLKFLDWVFFNEQVDIVVSRLELSKEELERTKRKRVSNLVDQADLIRSEDACCIGIRGNVDASNSELVNIADFMFIVAYLFQSGSTPPCPEEGDVNGDGNINVADYYYLYNYFFGDPNGPAPVSCP